MRECGERGRRSRHPQTSRLPVCLRGEYIAQPCNAAGTGRDSFIASDSQRARSAGPGPSLFLGRPQNASNPVEHYEYSARVFTPYPGVLDPNRASPDIVSG